MIIIPGINGSDDRHWQTLWQRSSPHASKRINPHSWDDPELEDWLHALDKALQGCDRPAILVAHSLGCLLVSSWAARNPSTSLIRGAFLVAPADPGSSAFPAVASSFDDPPLNPLGFPSLVIASTNDPFSSLEAAEKFAARWGSGFVNIGAVGHINSDSNIGDWPEGKGLLESFKAQLNSCTDSKTGIHG